MAKKKIDKFNETFVCTKATDDAIDWLKKNKAKIHDGGRSAEIIIIVN
jgi:hypothetical protein